MDCDIAADEFAPAIVQIVIRRQVSGEKESGHARPEGLRQARLGAFELDAGHEAAGALMKASLGMAVLVSLVHVAAMVSAGGCLAWLVYRHLGLRFVSRSWFNLDAIWATSLILVGVVALVFNLASWH